ncbi:MAG TPA: molybdopterin-dependent oxidoreductase, partial [Devosia sp.]|nr:molybdopterin-dependent oxidoreductase [Devosia sp.]
INEAVNEEWISDKTRFIWDGLKSQRLDRPYVRRNKKLAATTWDDAFASVAKAVKKAGARVGAIAGDLAGIEEMYALKALLAALDSTSVDARPAGSGLNPANGRASYIFNPTIAGIEQADAILLIGTNPRHEAAVLNARIRKVWRATGLPIGVIGEAADLTYSYSHLGAGTDTLADLVAGKGEFAETWAKAKKPLVIVGEGAANADVLATAAKLATGNAEIAEGWNGFAVLHNAAGRVGALDIGFVPGKGAADTAAMLSGGVDVLFLLGADELDLSKLGDTLVVYIGTHGDKGAHRADIILPAATYTEKSATYVNTEGRVQMTNRAVFAPGDGKEDWAIIRALSAVLGQALPFNSLTQLRSALYAQYPHLARLDTIAPGSTDDIAKLAKTAPKGAKRQFASAVADFYFTNPIARASAVMGEAAAVATGQRQAAE